MLLAFVQHRSPGDTALQDGSALFPKLKFGSQEYLGMNPYAIAEQITTPMG